MLLIQLPRVQTFLSQKVAAYLSSELQTTVSVGGVNIAFFKSLVLEDFYIADRSGDTLVSAQTFKADISLINFKEKKLQVDELTLNGAVVNLKVEKNEAQMNMDFLLRYFSKSDSSGTSTHWLLDFDALQLNSASFSYHDYNYDRNSTGIDYNHLEVFDIRGRFANTAIDDQKINTQIENLTFRESSGFHVHSLSSLASFSPSEIWFNELKITTDKSDIQAELAFKMENYASFRNFIEEVEMYSKFSKSELHTSDIAYFAPELTGFDLPVQITGEVLGTVDRLSGEDVRLRILNNTYFDGDFDIRGLPDYREAVIYVDVNELTTNAYDLQELNLPPFEDSTHIVIPDNLFQLGQVYFNGKLTGFFDDLVAYGNFRTNLGNLATDISLKLDEKDQLSYKGKLETFSFDAGRFFEIERLGQVSFSAKVSGKGVEKETLQLQMDGKINRLHYNGYAYKQISIRGNITDSKFLGDLSVKDKNLNLDFSGKIDLSGKEPVMDFTADIQKAYLANLNIFHQKDSLTNLTMKVEMSIQGKRLDDIQGKLLLSDVRYVDRKRDYSYDKIELASVKNDGSRKMILRSDILDAEVEGNYQLEELDQSLKELANLYIPSVQYEIVKPVQNNFDFHIHFKETQAVTSLFVPHLQLDSGGSLHGSYRSESKKLSLQGFFPRFHFSSLSFEEVFIEGKNDLDSLEINFDVAEVALADSGMIENMKVEFTSFFNTLRTKIAWKNETQKVNEAQINVETAFNGFDNYSMVFYDSYLAFADSLWTINKSNEVQVYQDQMDFYNFILSSGSQVVHIDGAIAKDSAAVMQIVLDNLDLEYFTAVIPSNFAEVKGIADGNISIQHFYSSPIVNFDLDFQDLAVNKVQIGSSKLHSVWDSETKSMEILAKVGAMDSTILQIEGAVSPYAEAEMLDLKVVVDSFPIGILSPYIEGYLSDLAGSISGGLKVKGDFKKPLLSGKFNLDSTYFTVDYLNTSYLINDEFFVEEDLIGFNLINIQDKFGNEAVATGSIFHDGYTDFNFDIGLEMKNFLGLNTGSKDNDLYFGKAIVSGLANITGFADQLIFDINITTERGTNFNIPLDRGLEVASTGFLTFTNSDTLRAELETYEVDLTGIELNFDLQMTPDAQVSLIFDEKIGDVMKAKGAGNLKLEINTFGDFNIFGQYVVEQGEYLFTLQNVINKKFEIEKGGSISWNGSPYNALIDIDAVYRLRASLYDILVDTIGSYKRRIPVDLKLLMSGNLLNPDIEFDIDVPTADDRARQALESILYLNQSQVNRQEMNQQVFGLLVLNRFLPPSGTGQVNENYQKTNIGAQSSSEFLSNQLSNWLSTLSDDVDIGIRYRPGNEISSDEVELELSTEILSDRVLLDGNFGYSNNEYSLRNQSNSGLIGEFSIEYKISKDGRFRVRGFNRSNNNSLLYTNSPYTQGFGIFYREEFNHLGELWRKWWQGSGRKEDESGLLSE